MRVGDREASHIASLPRAPRTSPFDPTGRLSGDSDRPSDPFSDQGCDLLELVQSSADPAHDLRSDSTACWVSAHVSGSPRNRDGNPNIDLAGTGTPDQSSSLAKLRWMRSLPPGSTKSVIACDPRFPLTPSNGAALGRKKPSKRRRKPDDLGIRAATVSPDEWARRARARDRSRLYRLLGRGLRAGMVCGASQHRWCQSG
jgi:hypothetical protein